jgi:hypothetical protein
MTYICLYLFQCQIQQQRKICLLENYSGCCGRYTKEIKDREFAYK